MNIKYPYSRPDVTSDDLAAITRAAGGQFLTQGPMVEAFERALCARLGGREAVVCNSGTAALHLIYMALGIGPTAGLLTTPVTFLATASAARMCGAPVGFVDVDLKTGLMTPETLAAAFNEAAFPVKAVAVVHLGGRVADLAGLSAVAARHGAVIVEDACHAPGASYIANGKRHSVGACAHSIAATFSFHAIKHVTMGEGGAVLVNDSALARSMRMLRSHGIIRDAADWIDPPEPNAPWYYEMHEIGWNYRADELACALGLSQLGRLDVGLERRRELVAAYKKLLGDIDALRLPECPIDPAAHAWHLYSVAIDFARLGRSRGQVMRDLASRGIGSQVHYIPLSHQPYYRPFTNRKLPGADAYYARTLSLPLYPALTYADQRAIADAVREVFASASQMI